MAPQSVEVAENGLKTKNDEVRKAQKQNLEYSY